MYITITRNKITKQIEKSRRNTYFPNAHEYGHLRTQFKDHAQPTLYWSNWLTLSLSLLHKSVNYQSEELNERFKAVVRRKKDEVPTTHMFGRPDLTSYLQIKATKAWVGYHALFIPRQRQAGLLGNVRKELKGRQSSVTSAIPLSSPWKKSVSLAGNFPRSRAPKRAWKGFGLPLKGS